MLKFEKFENVDCEVRGERRRACEVWNDRRFQKAECDVIKGGRLPVTGYSYVLRTEYSVLQ